MCIWRMYFHFVFRLVKYSTRSSHGRHHVLHGVPEPDVSLQQVGVHALGGVAAPRDLPHVGLEGDGDPGGPLAGPGDVHHGAGEGGEPGQGGEGGRALGQGVPAVDGHVGHAGGLAGGELETTKLSSRATITRLQNTVGRL